MHETVIKRLAGDDEYAERLLAPLRAAAQDAATALVAGDIDAYGAAMITNTLAQRGLHPALVSDPAQEVIDSGVPPRCRGLEGQWGGRRRRYGHPYRP